MSLTGTRSPDDRRRRRLAVAGEGADAADLDAGGVAILRERIGDMPSASPWLPRQRWKRNALTGMLWCFVAAVAFTLWQPWPPHPQIAPAVEHLTVGPRPILGIYTNIVLWTLAGQFASLVGWYRSHSQLDFQGRYRVWAWAAVVLTAWGFFAGTNLHTAIAAVAGPQLRWPIWRAEIMVWLVPALLTGFSVWWLADRDLQRNAPSVWLVRSAVLVLLTAGLGELLTREMATLSWFPVTLSACHLLGAALLVTGLWLQAWFVAYVSPDPPEPRDPIAWGAYAGAAWNRFRMLVGYLWPFHRREVTEAAKPKRRVTKKKEDEEEDEEEAAPKRRRKTAAKTKRVTKPRTRVKPEPEVEDETDDSGYEDEAVAEDGWEEVDDSSAEADDGWTEEYEEEEPAPPPARTPTRSTPAVNTAYQAPSAPKPASPPPKNEATTRSQPVAQAQSDDEDGDDEETQYRIDGGEGGADMFKGLSKKQRRELRKQIKDKERQRG